MSVDLTPGSPEWCRRMSPSKLAGALGFCPPDWDTPYSMWRKMRGDIPWDDESPAMERGNLCEPAVLAWWRKHYDHADWVEQWTHPLDDWCVATPDAVATHDGQLVIVEAKTAANMDEWGEPGTDAIPAYYLTQVYFAMEVLRRTGTPVEAAHIPVLGGYRLLFSNYVVPYDSAIGTDLFDRAKAFHDSLDGDAPSVDSGLATYEAVRKVHPDIERGESVELSEEAACCLVVGTADLKYLETETRGWRSRVIEEMGRAQYATHNGVKIARRQPHGDGIRFVVTAKPSDLTIEGSAA